MREYVGVAFGILGVATALLALNANADMKTSILAFAKYQQVCTDPKDFLFNGSTVSVHCGEQEWLFRDPARLLYELNQ